MPTKQKEQKTSAPRPPIVVVAGHIDHGKSTLLDYIRKTSTADKEAGGITQRISAYESTHTDSAGKEHKITFLDTPGHEAFCGIREKGVAAADIAVLVVSAEDGVKTQTLEALKCIKNSGIPFMVAISKIDKKGTNPEKIRQDLAEHEIYVEGYGGDVPCVAVSAVTGENISDLLDMITLVAEIHEIEAEKTKKAEGFIIESAIDHQKGISATVVIKNGTLKIGDYVVTENSWCPVRLVENWAGENIKEAFPGQPVKISGWSKPPSGNSFFKAVATKKEAEEESSRKTKMADKTPFFEIKDEKTRKLNIIVKTDTAGSAEAIIHEIKKNKTETVIVKIIHSGIGTINEGDVKLAGTADSTIIVGFNVRADARAKSLALRNNISVATFDIIYRLTEYISEEIEKRKPKIETEETEGRAKILKMFGDNKGKYIVGGRVEKGVLKTGDQIKLFRRDNEIGRGKIRNLQLQKEKVSEAQTGAEFGAMIETSVEPMPQDIIESFLLK